jgi:hypothetical protein
MTKQLELRREETKRLHSYVDVPPENGCILTETWARKCDELEAKLAELKSSAARILSQASEQSDEKVSRLEVSLTCLTASRLQQKTLQLLLPKMSQNGRKKSDNIVQCGAHRV